MLLSANLHKLFPGEVLRSDPLVFKAPLGDVTIVWDSNDGDGNQPRIDGYGTVTTETATNHESTAPVHRT